MPMLLLLCCWLALAPGWAQESGDPALFRARLHQEVLPELAARTQAAEARAAAGERWFEGSGTWSEAFPALASAPVGDPSYLRAQAWQLQERAEARAAQQALAAPEGLEAADADLIEPWRRALTQACQSEERADLLEQRFIAGLRAALERAPGLRDAAVQGRVDAWADIRAGVPADDPSSEQLALAAAAGDASGALEHLRQLAWRSATLPGDPALAAAVADQLEPVPDQLPVDPVADLALRARLDRLERVAPLLPGEQAAQILALVEAHELLELGGEKARLEAELAQEDSELAPASELPLAQLEARVEQLHDSLEHARQELTSLPDPVELPGPRRDVAQLRVWIHEKRLAVHQAALDKAQRLSAAGLEDDQSDARLAEARREADLARQQADDEAQRASQAEAALRLRVAELRQEIADLVEEEAARREAAVVDIEGLGERLAARADELAAALSLPPLDPQRQLRIDEAYLALRGLVDDSRSVLQQRSDALEALQHDRNARLAQLEQRRTELDLGVSSTGIQELVTAAHAARADLEQTLYDREDAASDEIVAVLQLLGKAKVQRRVGRSEASASARQEVSRAFLPELVAELAELPIRAGSQLRRAGPWITSLPAKLLDLGAIWVLIAGSVELLLLGLIWLWLRRAAPIWTERLVNRSAEAARDRDARGLPRWLALQAQRWLEPGDLNRLAPPWSALVRALVDVLASWQLARLLSDAPALIALLAWGFALVVLLRAVPAVVPALLATHSEERPALRNVSESSRQQVLWSARLVMVWWVVLLLCQVTALRLLDADRLFEVVNVVGTIAFWVLLVVLVHRWSPALVRALGEQPDSRLVQWARRSSSSWLLRTLQGGTALGLLLGQQAVRIGARLAGGGPSMSRLAALVARRQLRDSTERRGEPLAAPLVQRLEALRPPFDSVEQLQSEIQESHQAWIEHRRRGLRVITGDRGLGRTTLLGRLGRSLATVHKVVELTVEHRVDGPDAARGWLAAQLLGRSGGAPGHQELIDEISLLPGPRVYLLDDTERLFLREVGGFAALHEVLQVAHATSDEHFWICGFHGPTWAYLRGVPGVFDPALFERVHPLAPAGPGALARWLGTTVQQADLELSFDDLAGIGPNTLDVERLRGKARAAYWRLLADASSGNPQVARALFLGGASVEGRKLLVGLFDAPTPMQLQDVSDNELFVLTAVVVHDHLAVDQLARTLNLPQSGVRTACQRLVARGVLCSDGFEETSQYRLELPWLPAVERHLRNKNFLARQ